MNHKKEQSTDTGYNIDEPWTHCANWKKPDREGHVLRDSISIKMPEE